MQIEGNCICMHAPLVPLQQIETRDYTLTLTVSFANDCLLACLLMGRYTYEQRILNGTLKLNGWVRFHLLPEAEELLDRFASMPGQMSFFAVMTVVRVRARPPAQQDWVTFEPGTIVLAPGKPHRLCELRLGGEVKEQSWHLTGDQRHRQLANAYGLDMKDVVGFSVNPKTKGYHKFNSSANGTGDARSFTIDVRSLGLTSKELNAWLSTHPKFRPHSR